MGKGKLTGTLLLALGVALLAGCDLTGQYDKNFQAALQKSAQRAVFDLNLHAETTEVVDAARKPVGVKLRLPKFFDKDSKALDGKNPRATISVAIPPASYALERPLDDASGQFLPVYVIFVAVPKSEQKVEALQAALVQPVAGAPPPAWSDVTVNTPQGTPLALKRLRIEGKQPFPNQKNAPVLVDGKFDIYLVDAGNHHVLIVWKAPKAQAEKYSFDVASEAAMGTLEIDRSVGPAGKKASADGCF